jgi:hypothetical protein
VLLRAKYAMHMSVKTKGSVRAFDDDVMDNKLAIVILSEVCIIFLCLTGMYGTKPNKVIFDKCFYIHCEKLSN